MFDSIPLGNSAVFQIILLRRKDIDEQQIRTCSYLGLNLYSKATLPFWQVTITRLVVVCSVVRFCEDELKLNRGWMHPSRYLEGRLYIAHELRFT